MPRLTIRHIVELGMLAPITTASVAYEINPLKNKYRSSRTTGGVWERITETVHEDITDAAVVCADARARSARDQPRPPCSAAPTGVVRAGRGNKYDPLIRGVWWNDDPNQHLFGAHYGTWAVWMRDASGIATNSRNWLGRTTSLNSTYRMQYRSHYGDLQFLHAMASANGEPAEDVRKNMIDWIEFAYMVATGELEPETPLSEVSVPVIRRFFENQPGWTINYLFAPKYTLGKATIPDVALGSILHVVQDSFSEAHAQRDFKPTSGCPSGRMVQFHAYNLQDPDKHKKADTRQSWRTNPNFTATQNPVEASAQLLVFARDKADWSGVVKPYVETNLFCIDGKGEASGPGTFSRG